MIENPTPTAVQDETTPEEQTTATEVEMATNTLADHETKPAGGEYNLHTIVPGYIAIMLIGLLVIVEVF